MITNKIEAIRKIRAFCEQEFGSLSGLIETKDFVEALITRIDSAEKEYFVSKFRELLNIKGSFATPISWGTDRLRFVLKDAFHEATGEDL